jgi:hypothetical protein
MPHILGKPLERAKVQGKMPFKKIFRPSDKADINIMVE